MRLLITAVATVVLSQACLAQTGPVVTRAPGPARSTVDQDPSSGLVLRPGQAVMVTLDQSFAAIIVGSPELVDALAQTDRVFIVQANAKNTGETNIIVTNQTGQQIHNVHVRVTAGSVESGSVRVHHGSREGRLMIHDYAGWDCTNTYCARLPKGKERIREPPAPTIIFAPTTVVPAAP